MPSSDDFLLDLFDLDPGLATEIIREQAADQRRPPMGVEELLGLLARADVRRFADAIRRELA